MNSRQIDEHMKRRLPVMYDGHKYDRILEYVSWYDTNGNRQLSAVLIGNNTMCRVLADKVEPMEDNK